MKAFVVLAVVVGCSFGAPTEKLSGLNNLQRTKKSPEPSGEYGVSGYGAAPLVASAPCAGAGPVGPIALYLSPHGGVGPNYREDEHKEETAEHARSYYDSPAGMSVAAATGLKGSVAVPASLALAAAPGIGSAVGLFPNAKVGGCAIPLLLSCAPNVVSGHMAQHNAYPAAYRAHEAEHKHHQMREIAPASASEHGWAESERFANQMAQQLESQQSAPK